MGKHKWYEGIWLVRHEDKHGNILYKDTIKNILVDQGEFLMLDTFFRALNTPTTFYVRLCNDIVAETDTLSSVQNEPSGNGYVAAEVTRDNVGWPTLELNSGDYRVVSKELSYTASGGDIGPVNCAYLATTSDNSGYLISAVALALSRTVVDGDTLYLQLAVKLQ